MGLHGASQAFEVPGRLDFLVHQCDEWLASYIDVSPEKCTRVLAVASSACQGIHSNDRIFLRVHHLQCKAPSISLSGRNSTVIPHISMAGLPRTHQELTAN